ncbi:hypothetical protein GGR53DRAFT_247066 [Hypoxylon sp. FL1150]|nr:hypothetical protein GGR53DRAFT_247066 [Hypoxylon sp. FL1150]
MPPSSIPNAKMAAQPPNTLEPLHGPSYIENRLEKRRAQDSDSVSHPLSKRCRILKILSVPLALRCQPPHPLSVNGLIRKHCQDRLYVHPVKWTAQHLELLGYQFVRESNKKLRDHRHQRRRQKSLRLPSEAKIRATINHLRGPSIRDSKTTIVPEFLKTCNTIQLDKFRLPFEFKRRTITTLPVSGIFAHRRSAISLVYLDLECCVASKRDRSIGLSMSGNLDGPVWRMKQTQQRQLQPPNEAEDPYVVSVLIALAQILQYKPRPQNRSVNDPDECLESAPTKLDPTTLPRQAATDFKVQVLALARDAASLYLYTARIPSVSLDMLNEPSNHHDANVVLISYHVVQLTDCEKSVQNIKGILCSL